MKCFVAVVVIAALLGVNVNSQTVVFNVYGDSGKCTTPILSQSVVKGDCVSFAGTNVQSIRYQGLGTYSYHLFAFAASGCTGSTNSAVTLEANSCQPLDGGLGYSAHFFEIVTADPPRQAGATVFKYGNTGTCGGVPIQWVMQPNSCQNTGSSTVPSFWLRGCDEMGGCTYIGYGEADCGGSGSWNPDRSSCGQLSGPALAMTTDYYVFNVTA